MPSVRITAGSGVPLRAPGAVRLVGNADLLLTPTLAYTINAPVVVEEDPIFPPIEGGPTQYIYLFPVFEEFGVFPEPTSMGVRNLSAPVVVEDDPAFPAMRFVTYLIMQGKDVVRENDRVLPPVLLGAASPPGDLLWRADRDNAGAMWTPESVIDSGVDALSAGAVWLGNGWGAAYSQAGAVQWKFASDPEDWSAAAAAIGLTGRVWGLAQNDAGILCLLVDTTPVLSRDRGATWEPQASVPLTDRARAIVAAGPLFVIVQRDNTGVRHWISEDGGVTFA